jgi:hypothetical protein
LQAAANLLKGIMEIGKVIFVVRIKLIFLLLLLTSIVAASAFADQATVSTYYLHILNSNQVTVSLSPNGEAPKFMAIVVAQTKEAVANWEAQRDRILEAWRAEIKTNPRARFSIPPSPEDQLFANATWVPFATNVLVDLGPGDGERDIWFGFGDVANTPRNSAGWSGSTIIVRTIPPVITITNPPQQVVSTPMIELQGCSDTTLDSIRYSLIDEQGNVVENGEGSRNYSYSYTNQIQYKTNYFTCYDLSLKKGTNTVALQFADEAGNVTATNFTVVFTTEGDTNPPAISIRYPEDGDEISGSEFDLDGYCDDFTAKIRAYIVTDDGKTNVLSGFNERTGTMWVEHIPLADGTNRITLIATDAATNSSRLTLAVTKSPDVLYMDKIADPSQLWQPTIDVTGFTSRLDQDVFVNGVKTLVKPDGHWSATNVPVVSPHGGGTATFRLRNVPDTEDQKE